MQNRSKLFGNRALGWGVLFGFCLLHACTTVYFDAPVPQRAQPMTVFPAEWAGDYLAEQDAVETSSFLDQRVRTCFHLERISATQLLVTLDYRLHERDFPLLKQELEKQRQEGSLANYLLSETMLVVTTRKADKDEQQYMPMIRQGAWYVFSQTLEPYQFFDLEASTITQFQRKPHAVLEQSFMSIADSLGGDVTSLVARKSGKSGYFNMKDVESGKWSLLYVEQGAKDQLVVKTSVLEHPDDFRNRLEYYNSITTFRATDTDQIEAMPDDAALARLLAEEGLFQTIRLHRLEQ